MNISAKNKILRVGLIGLGNISRIHIQALLSHKMVRIEAIADTDKEKLAATMKVLPEARTHTTYTDLINDPTIDIVDILLPHYLHAGVAVAALQSGKHVISEKPLATTMRDILRIQKASDMCHRYVYTKQYFRFSALHRKVSDSILSGSIGKPYYVHCQYTTDDINAYNNPDTWRGNLYEAGGGIFMDVGVHIVDYLSGMFGKPISVTAISKKNFVRLSDKGEDLMVATIEFLGGVTANITCIASDTSYGFRWEKHFFGSEGSLHMEDFGKREMKMKVQKDKKVQDEFVEANWWNQSNIGAIHDIVNRVLDNAPPAISFDESLSTMQTILGAYDSVKNGTKIYLR